MSKVCNTCFIEQSLVNFHRDRNRKDGRSYRCKTCQSKYCSNKYSTDTEYKQRIIKHGKDWYRTVIKPQSNTPEHKKRKQNNSLTFNYGISLDEYNSLLVKQNNLCAICELPRSKRALAVDHCHTTNKIRGILCHKCNTAIGLLKEKPELFLKAAEYLKNSIL